MKYPPTAADPRREVPPAKPEDERVMGESQPQDSSEDSSLMAQVVDRDNLLQALKQVKRNKGAAGVDGMTVDELPAYLKQHWPEIKTQLLKGSYQPQPVLRVEIPKPDGRKRKLGIPTVLDRFIQQAIAQVLRWLWEPNFHPDSYGFRLMRSAHQAVYQARSYIRQGRKWVVDLDLDAFFDRVNHDRLMEKLKMRVSDNTLLRLINRYLKSGIEIDRKTVKTTEGVPQGSPLSPLLSNIVLDELDQELESRGHAFVRYADDVQIYVHSRRAGERVKQNLTRYIEHTLRLKVNVVKSAVDRPWNRTFLGFTFGSRNGYKLKVSGKALESLKQKVRQLSRRTRGHSLIQVIADLKKSLLGWTGFCSCKTCIHAIHGDQSLFRHCRNKEPAARSGQMDTAEVTVLCVEAMGQIGIP